MVYWMLAREIKVLKGELKSDDDWYIILKQELFILHKIYIEMYMFDDFKFKFSIKLGINYLCLF